MASSVAIVLNRDPMQCLIISFDSLATNSLGCYGNEWVETPNWDRLAATGAVFDSHFVDTLGPRSGMAWSSGQHALLPLPSHQSELGTVLRSIPVTSQLVVSGEVRPWQSAIPFDRVQQVGGRDGMDAKPDETPFAEVVKAGISAWQDPNFQSMPRLMWLHAPGPGVPPAGFETLYFEDFEERGQQIADLPDEARSRHPAVYAGSVSLLDHWLGELLAGIESDLVREPTLVLVMAARGYPWQSILPSKARPSHVLTLGDQLARVPLVLKVYGDQRFQVLTCLRSDRLVQSCDLVPTVMDWFRFEQATPADLGHSWLRELTEEIPRRPVLFYDDGGLHQAVRTQDWLCIAERMNSSHGTEEDEPAEPRTSLFVKPEDLWDVNNVASQQPEVVAELLEQFPRVRSLEKTAADSE